MGVIHCYAIFLPDTVETVVYTSILVSLESTRFFESLYLNNHTLEPNITEMFSHDDSRLGLPRGCGSL
jgi:hypothetical protein